MSAIYSVRRVGRLTQLVSGLGLAATVGAVAAHHGDAGRFEENTVTMTGTVVALQLINPHSSIILDIPDETGKNVRWQAEFGSPAQLANNFGWDRNTLKAGDRITITGRPLKSGQPYINLSERARILRTDSCEEIYHSRSEPDAPPSGPACN
jgi:DNA/RNA endonuclease YhcR with UshA esterase domain